jgi:ERF superfamily
MNRPTRAPPPPEDADFTEVQERYAPPEERLQHQAPAVRRTTTVTDGPIPGSEPAGEYQRHDFPLTGFAKLADAVANVMAEIKPVEKAGWNDFHRYNYARMQDLSTELTPLMGRHGIVVFQNELDRQMFDDGRVVAVRYEFTVVHRSGEIWPERPRYTGMSSCRNTKGGFDDKCFNKCHTSARKYFLIGLFQIPTGDEAGDGDAGEPAKPQQQQRPVRRAPTPEGKTGPHRLPIVDQEQPATWGQRYTAFINKAASKAEIDEWYTANEKVFEVLKGKHEDVYNQLLDAMDAREAVLVAPKQTNGNGTKQQKEDPISTGAPRRTSIQAPVDVSNVEWLDELRNAFSGCMDSESLSKEQIKRMVPMKNRVNGADWNTAVDIVNENLERIQSQR